MRKLVFAFAFALIAGACVIPVTFTPAPNPSPIVDTAGTAEAMMQTAVIQTLTAQPATTSAPLMSSDTPTSTLEVSPSPTETSTLVVDPTGTIATGTFEVPTSTDVPATNPVGPATSTLTPGVLTYGTLPPAVPFSQVTLINRAKTQAYISLQVVTAEGGPTIIEYPVSGQIKIKAPIGHYLYVAWVGGRKMVGEFRLHRDEDLSIILYRDRIEIK